MNDLDETDIDAALEDARGHHQAGRLAEAETLYRRVLDAQPRAAAVLSKLIREIAGETPSSDVAMASDVATERGPNAPAAVPSRRPHCAPGRRPGSVEYGGGCGGTEVPSKTAR